MISARKGEDGQLSASFDGEKLGLSIEFEGKNGRYGSAAMELDGLEETRRSPGCRSRARA